MMNERIKELADKAQEYAEWSTPQGLEWFDNFKEQFAELLEKEFFSQGYLAGKSDGIHEAARECISRAEDYGLGSDAVEQLKKDFGVE